MEPVPAPNRRRNQRGRQAQEQIMAAALKLFAERGFSGTSLSELAAEAGVGKPTLLYHYPDKDSLWRSAVDHLWADVDGFFTENWPSSVAPSRELLDRMLALFVEAAIRWPAYIRIPFVEGATESWRSRWLVERHFGPHVRTTDRILIALQKRGILPTGDPAFLQALMTSAINTIVAQSAMWEQAYGRPFHSRERLLELARMSVDGIMSAKTDRSVK